MLVEIHFHGASNKPGFPFYEVTVEGQSVGNVIEMPQGWIAHSSASDTPEASWEENEFSAMAEVLAQADVDNHERVAELWCASNAQLFRADAVSPDHDEVAEWREYDNKQRLSEVA